MSEQPLNVMVDLETLGTRPGCALLSIGAVVFDDRGTGPEFEVIVSRASCAAFGLREEPATLAWWARQSDAARAVLAASEGPEARELPDALAAFAEFLRPFGLDRVRIWGNGADFDNAILAASFAAVGRDLPWPYWNNRCFRTLKALHPEARVIRSGIHHRALDDARTQAHHALLLLGRAS